MTPDACPDYIPLLVRAGDDSLEPAALDRLERHVASCAGCRATLAAQQSVHRLLAARERARASADFAARVLSTIDRDTAGSWWEALDFRTWTWRIVPATAVLALLAYTFNAADGTTGTAGSTEATAVSAVLWSEQPQTEDVVSLMLFATPDEPLSDALKEIAQ